LSRPRICSWNVHECVGTDGRRDAARVAGVLREIDADVVVLQEVHADAERGGEFDQATYLAESTALHGVAGPTLERRGGRYGNLLLTRLRVEHVKRHDISVPGREPRGAIDAVLEAAAGPLRVVATHLGLGRFERSWQAQRLLETVGDPKESSRTLVVVGDWNEWVPWGRALRLARLRFGPHPAPATFPSWRPVLALDRVFVSPRGALVDVRIHRGPEARRASDHLPLVATLAPATTARPAGRDHPGPTPLVSGGTTHPDPGQTREEVHDDTSILMRQPRSEVEAT